MTKKTVWMDPDVVMDYGDDALKDLKVGKKPLFFNDAKMTPRAEAIKAMMAKYKMDEAGVNPSSLDYDKAGRITGGRRTGLNFYKDAKPSFLKMAQGYGSQILKSPYTKGAGVAGTALMLNEIIDWEELNKIRTAQKDPDKENFLDRFSRWWEFKNRQPGPPTTLHHDANTVESFGDIWRY